VEEEQKEEDGALEKSEHVESAESAESAEDEAEDADEDVSDDDNADDNTDDDEYDIEDEDDNSDEKDAKGNKDSEQERNAEDDDDTHDAKAEAEEHTEPYSGSIVSTATQSSAEAPNSGATEGSEFDAAESEDADYSSTIGENGSDASEPIFPSPSRTLRWSDLATDRPPRHRTDSIISEYSSQASDEYPIPISSRPASSLSASPVIIYYPQLGCNTTW
jgi:hypothetical protein